MDRMTRGMMKDFEKLENQDKGKQVENKP